MISYIQIGWKDEFSSTRILFHLIGKNIYETEIPCRAKQGESASNKALRGAKQSATKQGSSGSKTRGASPREVLKTFSAATPTIQSDPTAHRYSSVRHFLFVVVPFLVVTVSDRQIVVIVLKLLLLLQLLSEWC